MYGYIYKITNTINNKIYIGKHKSETFDLRYWGGGIALNAAYKKYGKKNFTREILEWCETAELLNDREIFWISEFNACDPSIGYNCSPGGDGAILVGDKNGMYGKHHTNESKQKISKTLNDMFLAGEINLQHLDGDKNGMYGRHHSDQSKQRMSATALDLEYHWYTDGVKNIQCNKHEAIPDGFHLGYTMSDSHLENVRIAQGKIDRYGENNPFYGKTHTSDTRKAISDTLKSKKRHWYTNGYDNLFISEGESIPDGFKPGLSITDETRKKQSDVKKGLLAGCRNGMYGRHDLCVYKDGVNKRIKPELLDDYLANGWTRGRCKTCKQ